MKKSEMQITQAQAAKELGWTQGAFSQYLNNITDLNPPAVIKLANFLGVDPVEIDPDIHKHLPNMVKQEVRFLASDPARRLNDRVVYADASTQFFMVVMDTPIFGAPSLPLNTLVLCANSDSTPMTRSADIPNRHYLVCYKNANQLEYVAEDNCPPKNKLKSKWTVHAFIIH